MAKKTGTQCPFFILAESLSEKDQSRWASAES